MTFRTITNISELRVGDIIRHVAEAQAMVVTDTCARYVIAVRTQHVSNPNEWEVMQRGIPDNDNY